MGSSRMGSRPRRAREGGAVVRLLCRFIPQAWIHGLAVEVDACGPVTFEVERDKAPAPFSYESDDLARDSNAPAWVREWYGPFEVDFEVIPPQSKAVPHA